MTFRRAELRESGRYRFRDWPSGGYSSYTFTGSRPGGAIAAAWAAFQFLGREGYRRIAASSMRARSLIEDGVCRIPGIGVHGEPDLWAFSFGAEGLDHGKVAGLMASHGWISGITTSPPGIHVMATPVHEPYAGEFVDEVARCVAAVRSGEGAAREAAYN